MDLKFEWKNLAATELAPDKFSGTDSDQDTESFI